MHSYNHFNYDTFKYRKILTALNILNLFITTLVINIIQQCISSSFNIIAL